jgi:hypothetical protein
MYNMEIYCTRRYCIENPYWTIYYTAEMINTITTILCLTFNSLNRITAQQYFVRKMLCNNTDLVISKMN